MGCPKELAREAEQFALTEAARDGDVDERTEAILFRRVEQDLHFICRAFRSRSQFFDPPVQDVETGEILWRATYLRPGKVMLFDVFVVE